MPIKTISFVVLAILFLAVVGVAKWLFEEYEKKQKGSGVQGRHGPPPYRRKKYLMTSAEKQFYDVLLRVAGSDLAVCPQVTLSHLFLVTAKGREFRGWFNKIDRKSVDFVLCTRAKMQPIVAIELDESSHRREDRQIRDRFVNDVFQATGLPLLRIWANPGGYQDEEVARAIRECIRPATSTS